MDALTILACALLLVGSAAYIFRKDRGLRTPAVKTRRDYLHERKEVVYDNLRDLNFEYRAGKYPAEDYAAQREILEGEAASIVAELDKLEAAAVPR